MAIITCTARADGSLIPSAVEFEPDDLIQLASDKPSKAILVKGSFTLEGVTARAGDSGALLGVSADGALFVNVHFPPPGGGGRPPVTIRVAPKQTHKPA